MKIQSSLLTKIAILIHTRVHFITLITFTMDRTTVRKDTINVGYCYGWGNNTDCTILIIGNVYIIEPSTNLCCNALSGNYGVPIDWLGPATWLGEETVNGVQVNHWYFAEHEYWSNIAEPYEGVRYSGPNFKTPRQFTNYQPWEYGPQDSSLFQLPAGIDCSQPCP